MEPQGGTTERTLKVQGHAVLAAAPDRATITLGAVSRAEDARAALADNARTLDAVIHAVEDLGVERSAMQTMNLSIHPDPETGQYVVSHQLNVHVGDVLKVGEALDAAVAAGANASGGVSFGLTDPSELMAQALREAVADAQARAESITSALGVEIVGVVSAAQLGPGGVGVSFAARAPSHMYRSIVSPVQGGEVQVSADVEVVYSIRQEVRHAGGGGS